MSWHFSQALVADYSQATCSDGEQFAPLKETVTPEAYCWRDKTTESLDLFQSGMMSAPSTENLGEDLLTWFQEDFRAKTSVLPVQCGGETESTEPVAACGGNISGSSTKLNRLTFSGRTRPNSEARVSTSSFESFPSEGMFANGQLSGLTTSDFPTAENAYGFTLPTPTARDWKDTPGMSLTRKDGKTRTDRLPMLLFACVQNAGVNWKQMTSTAAQTVTVKGLKVLICGKDYGPELPEWMMAWPIGWTDLKPLETAKYQSWLRLLGDF